MRLENLTYDEYRDIAEDGDVVFLHGTQDIVQRLIMFATGSKYCHVALAFWADIGGRRRLMIVESQGGTKRRIISASYYKARTIDVLRAPRPWHEICDEALSQIGEAEYGLLVAIWIGVQEYAMRRFGLTIKGIPSQPGEICSTFIANLMELDVITISPGKLYEKLKVLYPHQ